MKSLTTATLLCALLWASAALAVDVTGASVLDYGVYAYDEKKVSVHQVPGQHGEQAKISNIRFVKKTLRVPLKQDTFFAVHFVVHSVPEQELVDIELRVVNPAGEISKGVLKIVTEETNVSNIEFGPGDQPGTYTFSVLHNDKELFSRKIILYKQ